MRRDLKMEGLESRQMMTANLEIGEPSQSDAATYSDDVSFYFEKIDFLGDEVDEGNGGDLKATPDDAPTQIPTMLAGLR